MKTTKVKQYEAVEDAMSNISLDFPNNCEDRSCIRTKNHKGLHCVIF